MSSVTYDRRKTHIRPDEFLNAQALRFAARKLRDDDHIVILDPKATKFASNKLKYASNKLKYASRKN